MDTSDRDVHVVNLYSFAFTTQTFPVPSIATSLGELNQGVNHGTVVVL
ncbi:MAG: hypothetical protein ACOYLE_05305 [Bacteroidales bacterium]